MLILWNLSLRNVGSYGSTLHHMQQDLSLPRHRHDSTESRAVAFCHHSHGVPCGDLIQFCHSVLLRLSLNTLTKMTHDFHENIIFKNIQFHES